MGGGKMPDRASLKWTELPERFFVRNYPKKLQPKVDAWIAGKALRCGAIEIEGQTFACLGFGKLHGVPVVTVKK